MKVQVINYYIFAVFSSKQLSSIKFVYSEKATKIEDISLLVLTLLSNFKAIREKEICSNFSGLLSELKL